MVWTKLTGVKSMERGIGEFTPINLVRSILESLETYVWKHLEYLGWRLLDGLEHKWCRMSSPLEHKRRGTYTYQVNYWSSWRGLPNNVAWWVWSLCFLCSKAEVLLHHLCSKLLCLGWLPVFIALFSLSSRSFWTQFWPFFDHSTYFSTRYFLLFFCRTLFPVQLCFQFRFFHLLSMCVLTPYIPVLTLSVRVGIALAGFIQRDSLHLGLTNYFNINQVNFYTTVLVLNKGIPKSCLRPYLWSCLNFILNWDYKHQYNSLNKGISHLSLLLFGFVLQSSKKN